MTKTINIPPPLPSIHSWGVWCFLHLALTMETGFKEAYVMYEDIAVLGLFFAKVIT